MQFMYPASFTFRRKISVWRCFFFICFVHSLIVYRSHEYLKLSLLLLENEFLMYEFNISISTAFRRMLNDGSCVYRIRMHDSMNFFPVFFIYLILTTFSINQTFLFYTFCSNAAFWYSVASLVHFLSFV